MCGMVVQEIAEGNIQVKTDAMRIMGANYPTHALNKNTVINLTSDQRNKNLGQISNISNTSNKNSNISNKINDGIDGIEVQGLEVEVEVTSEELCSSILHTVYMGTGNSSFATRSRSQRLGKAIGSYHNAINIDIIVTSVLSVFTTLTSLCSDTGDKVSTRTTTSFIFSHFFATLPFILLLFLSLICHLWSIMFLFNFNLIRYLSSFIGMIFSMLFSC